ncbi:hypothetical protein SAMN05216188_11866 [Lentzea xinjiangensis]|uniref:Uncharacterized protein n=1 Tax=Lentzea xinjiangensis TaxID=402600 RepID=A0A1H9TER9_9PSEU|nr:hypothetical protein [Lentzea xinjiangensis]SER95464.1 hypothetical protein SAMN05216188_11866 [Lentzea xinjiangensis]
MPNPQNRTPDHIRAEVADYIRAHAGTPEGSVRAIARRFGIGKTTVGVIADEHGLGDAWLEGAEQTAAATEARRVHLGRQRALLQEDLLDSAADLVDRIHDEVVHLNVVKDGGEDGGEHVEHTVLPPGPADYRAMSAAIATFSKAAVDLAKLDNDTSRTDASVGLLDRFWEALVNDPETIGDDEDDEAPTPSEPVE